jgi:polar amino acid transport system permease protein
MAGPASAVLSAGPFRVPWGDYLDPLSSALVQTLKFTAGGFVGATVLGLLVALMRLAPLRPVRWLAHAYTDLFRNLPLITEVYIIYFGLASVGLLVGKFTAGVAALTLFYGAYLSEIFRAGLQGVTDDQREAGQALGLTSLATLRLVVLPQAVRLALPGTTTMMVDLLKSTSLLIVISGGELMTEASLITSDTFRAMEVYLVIGAVYFALCYPLSQLALALERRLRKGLPLSPKRIARWRIMRELAAQYGADAKFEGRPSAPAAS